MTGDSSDSEPPKNGLARELYFIGRDHPEQVEEMFEEDDDDA